MIENQIFLQRQGEGKKFSKFFTFSYLNFLLNKKKNLNERANYMLSLQRLEEDLLRGILNTFLAIRKKSRMMSRSKSILVS